MYSSDMTCQLDAILAIFAALWTLLLIIYMHTFDMNSQLYTILELCIAYQTLRLTIIDTCFTFFRCFLFDILMVDPSHVLTACDPSR